MSKKMSKKETAIAYYILKGYKEIESTDSRYAVLVSPYSDSKIFVGKSGAIRRGKSIFTSESITDHISHTLMAEVVKESKTK